MYGRYYTGAATALKVRYFIGLGSEARETTRLSSSVTY
jgi:plasmid replication initiation protein